MSIVARLLTAETHDRWVALSTHVIDIHRSGTIFWRWGAEALYRGGWSEAWEHFLHQSKCRFRLGRRWSGVYGVAHHVSVCFHKGFICLSVLGHLACSLVPSFRVIEVRGPISKQCNLVLKCWIKSTSELDDNRFVIVIFCQVGELLEAVNIVVNWVLGLVPAGPF